MKEASHWDKWKIAIETEIASLYKRKVFLAVMPTPPGVLLVGTNGFSFAKGMKTTKW